ncbi:MAG: DUF1667 domain-containing protein [Kiritimatiellae bacterium]|nr:DUF1667 domain-containing protein [Kiritimatiellia bacterium]
MICISCPRGCEMDVSAAGGAVSVSGNACPKGEAYAKSEVTNPTRMVTGLVRVAGMRKPLPVKTKVPVPKAKIDAVLFAMHQAAAQLPVAIGDVIIPNVAETGVDLVATANM